MHPMDGVFSLPEADRTEYLRSLVQCFGCAYVCLWSYDHSRLPNPLFFLDGCYNLIRNGQPSSSSVGSAAAQRLFDQFRSLRFDPNDDRVPGLAFRNQNPYLELHQLDLLRLAATEIQARFFKEARIKKAIFMGCNKGEIELGFLNMSKADIQTTLGSLFPEDFSRQSQQQPIDQNPLSSSSSSLRSLSTGSPEYTSLMFTIPGTSPQSHLIPATLGGVVPPTVPLVSTTPPSTTSLDQQQQAFQALARVPTPTQFLTPEGEHDAITRAILNVLSGSPFSSISLQQPQQNLPYASSSSSVVHPEEVSAFKRYRPNITSQMVSNLRRQSLLKRSFSFFRNLNLMRIRESIPATRPTSTQLHHMISERRRREKLNENFQALRALLPPGTKKDKASILKAAKETLKSLMAEIEKLSKRNQHLMSSLAGKELSSTEETKATISSNERFNVQVSHVPGSSSSEEPMVDLQVNVRGQVSQVDLFIRLLEFLKQAHTVSLISTDANTHVAEEGTNVSQVTFRLRIIEGSEWDESAFQEAVRRVVADMKE